MTIEQKPELESQEDASERLAGASLSDRERAQLWQRIEHTVAARNESRVRWPRRVAVIAAPALAALVLLLSRSPNEAPVAHQPEASSIEACTLDPAAQALRLPSGCAATSVQIEGDDWQLDDGAEVARIEHGARVEQGRVQFRVRPRKSTGKPPFVVRVSHGQVQVIGTVFVVEQQGKRGSVRVSEGTIEFVWDDGQRERVSAGETLHWPRVTPPEPPPETEEPEEPTEPKLEPGSSEPKAPDLEAVLERLLQMRSQERFPEAVELLRATLSQRGLSHVQRERISYELGLALESSGSESCEHWRAHVARFGQRRHKDALEQRLSRCK